MKASIKARLDSMQYTDKRSKLLQELLGAMRVMCVHLLHVFHGRMTLMSCPMRFDDSQQILYVRTALLSSDRQTPTVRSLLIIFNILRWADGTRVIGLKVMS